MMREVGEEAMSVGSRAMGWVRGGRSFGAGGDIVVEELKTLEWRWVV